MSDLNTCSELPIHNVELPNPFIQMYNLQKYFQNSLGKTYGEDTPQQTAQKCIYWFYCIISECRELLDWFEHTHNLPPEKVEKEIQMEAIDILHFVMNIGLELGVTDEEIQAITDAECEMQNEQSFSDCNAFCEQLVASCVGLIDQLPWKMWRQYPDATIDKEGFAAVYANALLVCGSTNLSRQDTINVYHAKNKENIERQKRGY